MASGPSDIRRRFRTACNACGRPFNVLAGQAGQVVACPHCGRYAGVPADLLNASRELRRAGLPKPPAPGIGDPPRRGGPAALSPNQRISLMVVGMVLAAGVGIAWILRPPPASSTGHAARPIADADPARAATRAPAETIPANVAPAPGLSPARATTPETVVRASTGAISGGTAVIPLLANPDSGIILRPPYVVQRDRGGSERWGTTAELAVPAAGWHTYFGNTRYLAVDGDTVILGSPANDDYSGAAFVFQRDQGGPGNWGLVARLVAPGATRDEWFGRRLAVSNDTAVIGGSGSAAVAHVFRRTGVPPGQWNPVAKLEAPQAGLSLGCSIAISGNTVIIGADEDGDAGYRSGAVYLFERSSDSRDDWSLVSKTSAPDAKADDHFGVSVAISGDTAVVGAEGWEEGAAYVMRRDELGPIVWSVATKLRLLPPGFQNRFGKSVAIAADTILVGAPGVVRGDGNTSSSHGAVYVHRRNQGGPNRWGQVAQLTAGGDKTADRFGNFVSMDGNTAYIAACGSDCESGRTPCAVYIFERSNAQADDWHLAAILGTAPPGVADQTWATLRAACSTFTEQDLMGMVERCRGFRAQGQKRWAMEMALDVTPHAELSQADWNAFQQCYSAVIAYVWSDADSGPQTSRQPAP